jgi:hypothetical protein
MAEPTKRVYESTTLGLPPLRMVLVHARNEAQNAANRPTLSIVRVQEEEQAPVDREKAIRRIIEALEEAE